MLIKSYADKVAIIIDDGCSFMHSSNFQRFHLGERHTDSLIIVRDYLADTVAFARGSASHVGVLYKMCSGGCRFVLSVAL